jgi:pimeloyl-ACP methyl ester carboxylesterase
MSMQEKKYLTDDNLNIYYRTYGKYNPSKPTILCLPGLTRNSKSFHHYAVHCLETFNAYIISPDMRGRGQSDYDKNYDNYNLMRETQDILHIIMHEKLTDIIIFGTSRGGMQACMLAPILQNKLKSVILNDIGVKIPMPVMDSLKQLFNHTTNKIGDYSAALKAFYDNDKNMTNHLSAAQEYDIINATYKLENNIYYLDYDYQGMKIAYEKSVDHLKQINSEICDLKALFTSLAYIPVLLLHGENSKLLTPDIIKETQEVLYFMHYKTIANRGHCPYLNEPEVIKLCDNFLQSYF